jgi:hypothetical protein
MLRVNEHLPVEF